MRSSKRDRCLRLGVVALGSCVLAVDASFADWQIVPDLELAVQARENPRLGDRGIVAEQDDVATSMLFNGRFTMSNASPRGELYLQPRIRADVYSDDANSDLESRDLFLDARARRLWRTTTAGFRSFFSRESILHGEIIDARPIDPNIEDPIAIDTGSLVQLDGERSRGTIAPYVDVKISDRSSLLFETRFLDVSYSGTSAATRTDINDTALSVGISRRIDDRNSAAARVIASKFEADRNSNVTDTVAVEGSFSRVISSAWSFNLTTGLMRNDISFRNAQARLIQDVDTNFTFSLGFRKRTERTTLNLDIRRFVDPNSSGYLEQRDELRMSVVRLLSPMMTGGVAFRAIDTEALGDTITTSTRDYARLGLTLEWALSRIWSVGVGYDVIYQKFDADADHATSNAVTVGVNYRGLSRVQN